MKKWAIFVITFWLILTGAVIFYNESILITGREIRLEILPVDPRDFLRGDYISLSYKISSPEHRRDRFKGEKKVYVELKLLNGNYTLDNITITKPKNSLFIVGDYSNERFIRFPNIQKYFIKEGEGKKLEKELVNGGYAKILVDKNGNARIKGVVSK